MRRNGSNRLDEAPVVGITTDFLDFLAGVQIRAVIEPSEWRRGYDHFEHAEVRLATASTKHDRIDIVAALKRAIDVRVAFLAKLYDLKSAPGLRRAKNRFEALVRVGLIRPIMSKELFDIRDAVEHRDADPPSIADCQRFTEFTWYFLKTTDTAASSPALDLMFEYEIEGAGEYWASVARELNPAWDFTIMGWFPEEDVHESPDPTDIIVRVEKYETARDAKDSGIGPDHGAFDRKDSDKFLVGSINVPAPVDERIVALFLTTA